jgi:hypothetical protein
MRRMVLSESVNERERPGDFVGLSIATLRMILRRGVLPEYSGKTVVKKFSESELGISVRIFRKIHRPHIHTAVSELCGRHLSKRSYPRLPDQLLLEERRRTFRRLARVRASASDKETGVCHRLGGNGK